jgi:acetyl esterase
MAMPLDPQAKAVLDQMAPPGAPPVETLPLEVIRQGRGSPERYGIPEEVAQVQDRNISGPAGEIPVRVYTPEVRGPFPALVYFHGGGFALGSIDLGTDVLCRVLANRAGCVVVSVDYRLAPEHRFPAGLEDAYAATCWTAEQAARIQVDPDRLAVGGDSAGGNLATGVCLLARERSGPRIACQVMLYPVTTTALDSPSWDENEGYVMTRAFVSRLLDYYFRSKADARSPYVAPLLAEDLSGLPRALVITAEYDPLRDEGEAYARRLQEAGVPVRVKRYEGMIHGFMTMLGAMDRGMQAVAEVATELREALA